jgi:hypothetical protein
MALEMVHSEVIDCIFPASPEIEMGIPITLVEAEVI